MRAVVTYLTALAMAATATAQNIILKDGKVIATKGVRRSGDTIMATVELPALPPPSATQPGQPAPPASPPRTGELGYPIAQIARIDFPEPAQLKTAAALVNAGKAAEGLKQIEPVLSYYGAVRDAPGSWWSDAMILKAQALASLGREAEAEGLAEGMARVATDPEAVRAARVFGAASVARKGEHSKVIEICQGVLDEATRPQTLAMAAALKGQSHVARREWDAALLSLLEVPVFYPRQEILMPRVMLGAARAYIGLGDLPRAKVSLEELGSKFAATPEGVEGQAELEKIQQLEKGP